MRRARTHPILGVRLSAETAGVLDPAVRDFVAWRSGVMMFGIACHFGVPHVGNANMRIALILAAATLAASTAADAASNTTKGAVGGAVAGAVVAGPVGALAGGVGGAYAGSKWKHHGHGKHWHKRHGRHHHRH
jgi:hypothetical protein